MLTILDGLLFMALGMSLCLVEPQEGIWAGIEVLAYMFGIISASFGSFLYWSSIAEITEGTNGDDRFFVLVPLMGFVAFSIRCITGSGGSTLWSIEFMRTGWLWAHGAFHVELYTGWWRGAVPQMIDFIVEKQKKSAGE